MSSRFQFPIDCHCWTAKKEQQIVKIQSFKFYNSFSNVDRHPPTPPSRTIYRILESESFFFFQSRFRLKLSFPHVKGKQNAKSPNLKSLWTLAETGSYPPNLALLRLAVSENDGRQREVKWNTVNILTATDRTVFFCEIQQKHSSQKAVGSIFVIRYQPTVSDGQCGRPYKVHTLDFEI